MKAIIPDISENSSKPYYLQLYEYIKQAILSEEIQEQEKLPSLRRLSKTLNLSITTIELAYSQLQVEGYIYSKPQSGYYVGKISHSPNTAAVSQPPHAPQAPLLQESSLDMALKKQDSFFYDPECFDFNKWKKCINKVLTEYTPLLSFQSDPQGEPALRYEISRYLYQSRGVSCHPDQIVIGAGTQQITNHLATILKKIAIDHITVEEPGYIPVKNIFRDRGFSITPVTVGKNGLLIEKLPANIRSAVYVTPSNQVPTGAVMPVGRRYELLNWARENDSIIIEDDYDSELRYFGRPIPALQGLDTNRSVVYLGSFSATLFPSVKISYMVLPEQMAEIFETIRNDYIQPCSKTEQLTLALFMEKGYYQTNIKKLRNLYGQKCAVAASCLTTEFSKPTNTSSGINMVIDVLGEKSAETLCREAGELNIPAIPTTAYGGKQSEHAHTLILHYNQIPLKEIPKVMGELTEKWRK